jgi:hypothetical protein
VDINFYLKQYSRNAELDLWFFILFRRHN